MTYETVSRAVQHFGPLFFGTIFLIAVAYALWPKNKDTFKRASRMALDEED
ncbi:MAG: cbb3-type cytochrome c oxidase subunit 3 [Caulobacteraceae bacterium]